MPARLRTAFLVAPALALGVFATPPALAQSVDQRPSTPAGLVATVYSATGGSVRWQRSTDNEGLVRGYEVARDGEVLGVFDSLSYVDRSLEPGRSYRFRVRAVDSSGQRSARAYVTLETLDARPAAPVEVRADVYSRRTAELFWKRSGVFGERYLIKRDGQEVATTDGTSYIDRTLSTARPYLFEVIALNRQGQRSTPTRLFVSTAGGANPVEPPVPTLAAPAGLRFSTYSSTTVELFWDRPSTPGLRYEVRRDAAVVTTTDGTSYLDRTLEEGAERVYEVIAIDAAGRRSAPSRLRVKVENPNAPPARSEVALDELFGELIVSLGVYKADTDVARVLEFADSAMGTALASRPAIGTDVSQTFAGDEFGRAFPLSGTGATTTGVEYDCALGGRFALEEYAFEGSMGEDRADYDFTLFRFEECRLAGDGGETVVGGTLFVTEDVTSGPNFFDRPVEANERRHTWDGFSFAKADGSGLAIDGTTAYTTRSDVENSNFRSRDRYALISSYVETVDGAPLTRLEDVRFTLQRSTRDDSVADNYTLSVFGKVRSAATGGRGVVVPQRELAKVRPVLADGSLGAWMTLGAGLEFQSNDGGFLQATARETDTEVLFFDLDFLGPDGERRRTENVPLPDLATPTPGEVAAAIEEARS